MDLALICLFAFGYLSILSESWLKVNKTASALLMAILLWGVLFQGVGLEQGQLLLGTRLNEVSQIALFLLGAMTLVELVDAHEGFRLVSGWISAVSGRLLVGVIGILAFFLSALLDNLTTTIVLVALIRKLGFRQEHRLLLGALTVVAANAGGAWTPIGDVTTTMLWIQGNIDTVPLMKALFLPSFGAFLVALIWIVFSFPRQIEAAHNVEPVKEDVGKSRWVLLIGAAALVMTPVLHAFFGLPPFMGIFLGLALLWIATDLIHWRYPHQQHLRVHYILKQVDTSGVLFFIGILLAIDALDGAGILKGLALWLDQVVGSMSLVALLIGAISAVIDNIPLVAAGMGMYAFLPSNDPFWYLLAYAAGTGGSILLLGSAAGIAFMQMEKVSFSWYCKYVTPMAILSYLVGAGIYFLQ
jgi:Na+/H+ antiporter NhaD/arsenite permease-like protein